MKHTLNILMIGTTEEQGGAAKPGWEIGQQLSKRGHIVNYIVGYKKTKSENVYELRSPLSKWIDEKSGYNLSSLFKHARAYFFANDIDFGAENEILNHKWYKEADIVHCHNLHGNFFKLQTLQKISGEKPTVWTLQDMWPITAHSAYYYDDEPFDKGKRFIKDRKRYEPMLWNNTSYLWHKKKKIYKGSKLNLVSPSKWLATLVNKSILSGHKIIIIPNFTDTKLFTVKNKASLRKKLRLPIDKKIILYLAQGGLTDPRKGWKYAEELINKFDTHEVLFVSVGDKPPKSAPSKVKYIPFRNSRQDVANYMAASDIFLFPSLADNCPLSVLEALASGLVVVGFKTGGTPEIVGHKENGYMAEYKNVHDLENGISWALNMSSKDLKLITKRNRAKAVKLYSGEIMAKKYLSLYYSLLK